MITWTAAERRNIEDFYEHRKLVLKQIQAAIEQEKKKRSRHK